MVARVGRYLLGELLGRGGMGEVYRAHDERLRRDVAIKRIRAAGLPEGAAELRRARLLREARLAAQIGHPAIVQVFDLIEDESGDWVVMELASGRTLAALLDEGPVPIAAALRYGAAIADALDAAHRHGIVHRDLKVENVMLSERGQIKILDFGLAKQLSLAGGAAGGASEGAAGDAATGASASLSAGLSANPSANLSVEGQVIGTVRAMSPEQARGLELDARSDLFSLGTLLYELIAARSPFAAATPLETLLRVASHRQAPLDSLPERAGQVPPALSALVDQLLEKAPERRPASAAAVRDQLRALVEEVEGQGESAGDAGQGSRPGRARGNGATPRAEAETAQLTPTPTRQPVAEAREVARSTPEEPSGATASTLELASSGRASELAPQSAEPASSVHPVAPRSRSRLLLLGAGLAASLLLASLSRWRSSSAPEPSPPPSSSPSSSSSSSPSSSPSSPLSAPRTASSATRTDAPLPDPRAEYERAMALLREFHRPGAVDEAAAAFQRLLRADERSAPAYAGLARALWHRYAYVDASRDAMYLQQAEAAAQRAVALDELLVAARVSRGLVSIELGRLELAAADLELARSLDAGDADVHDALARLHLLRQDLDGAEAAFRKAIELAPRQRHLYDDLGALQVQRGAYVDAISLFEESIALAPDSPYGYSNLGAVHLLQGRYDEAAARFQDALKIRPSASLYSNLGTVLFAQGLYAPAASAYERALAMGGAANVHLYWGNLADAYRLLPDPPRAAEAYARALELLAAELAKAPEDLTLRSRRALYLAKRGDCHAADAELAALGAARGATPYSLFRIAVTLEVCARRARAVAALERALAAGFSAAEVANDPELRALRADPAYHRMLHRRGGAQLNRPASPR